MKYWLVLQWPASDFADFDALVALEDKIIAALGRDAVDGHDLGSGEANIFTLTDTPRETFEKLRSTVLRGPRMSNIKAAFREADGEDYTVVWPPGERRFTII